MDHEKQRTARLWRGVVAVMVAGFFVLGATPAVDAGEWRISFGSPHRYYSDDYRAGHHYEAGRYHLPYYGHRRFYRPRYYGHRRFYRSRYYNPRRYYHPRYYGHR